MPPLNLREMNGRFNTISNALNKLDNNLLSVGNHVKKELSEMEQIKTKFDLLFKNGDTDRPIYVKKTSGKIVDVSLTEKKDYEKGE